MNLLVNMLIMSEKELEWERQGLRRTRRYIGDARQVIDARWYQAQSPRVTALEYAHEDEIQMAGHTSRPAARRSIVARLSHQPRPRCQPACNEG